MPKARIRPSRIHKRTPRSRLMINLKRKLRYKDEPGPGTRICSCHFEGGDKENGPSIFPHNIDKIFRPHHLSPEPRRRIGRPPKVSNEDIPNTSVDESISLDLIELDAGTETSFILKVECEESVVEQLPKSTVQAIDYLNDKKNKTSIIDIKSELSSYEIKDIKIKDEIITDANFTEEEVKIKREYEDLPCDNILNE